MDFVPFGRNEPTGRTSRGAAKAAATLDGRKSAPAVAGTLGAIWHRGLCACFPKSRENRGFVLARSVRRTSVTT